MRVHVAHWWLTIHRLHGAGRADPQGDRALAALGHETVPLHILPIATVRERAVRSWAQVRAGRYTEADARAVLRAYFGGNTRWRTTETAAPLLECPPPESLVFP